MDAERLRAFLPPTALADCAIALISACFATWQLRRLLAYLQRNHDAAWRKITQAPEGLRLRVFRFLRDREVVALNDAKAARMAVACYFAASIAIALLICAVVVIVGWLVIIGRDG